MAFWDFFKKKKKEPDLQEQEFPTLAGIPAVNEDWRKPVSEDWGNPISEDWGNPVSEDWDHPVTMGGLSPDPEPAFISPPPYLTNVQEPASGLPLDIIPQEPERSFAPPAVMEGEKEDEKKAYPLVFYLMEDNICTTKIDYACYEQEQPEDILQRMQKDGRLLRMPGYAYRILYWPTKDGMSTVDRLDSSEPKRVSEIDPKPDSVFIIQQYRTQEEPRETEPLYTLYGCPTAALPEQENILRNSSVDTVTFD